MATALVPIFMLGLLTGRIRAMAWERSDSKTAGIVFITLLLRNFLGIRV